MQSSALQGSVYAQECHTINSVTQSVTDTDASGGADMVLIHVP